MYEEKTIQITLSTNGGSWKLISSLQELEHHNIVVRTVVEAIPPQVEYSLSKYGQSVRPVLETLFGWGEGHIKKHSDKIFY